MKVLFLDESGDHNLTVIDPQYPLFVLGGVILDKDYAEGELTREVKALKQELFGRTDLVLHTADITRNRNGFERMQETAFRERFYEKGRQVLGKTQKEDWRIVESKLRRGPKGNYQGYGLVVLPK